MTVSCTGNGMYRNYRYFAMDTVVTICLPADMDEKQASAAADRCSRILSDIEMHLSSKNENGGVYILNHSEEHFSADDVIAEITAKSESIRVLTDGAFDYTLSPLIELWNVTGGGPVPAQSDISDALSRTGADKVRAGENGVELYDGAGLDFGGIGKGYAAVLITEELKSSGIPYGMVSVGGNISVWGEKPDGTEYKIGIKDPENTDSVIGYVYLDAGFVSVSGDYERFFEENGKRYHHIIDGSTGYPAESGLHSAAVISSDGTEADALSTALFVMGEEKALEFYRLGKADFEAVLVADDGRIIMTDGIKDKFEFYEGAVN